eukprot:sb/3472392/
MKICNSNLLVLLHRKIKNNSMNNTTIFPSINPLTSTAQECKIPEIRDGIVTGPKPLTPGSALIIQCRAGYTLTTTYPTTCVTLEQYHPTILPHCVPEPITPPTVNPGSGDESGGGNPLATLVGILLALVIILVIVVIVFVVLIRDEKYVSSSPVFDSDQIRGIIEG